MSSRKNQSRLPAPKGSEPEGSSTDRRQAARRSHKSWLPATTGSVPAGCVPEGSQPGEKCRLKPWLPPSTGWVPANSDVPSGSTQAPRPAATRKKTEEPEPLFLPRTPTPPPPAVRTEESLFTAPPSPAVTREGTPEVQVVRTISRATCQCRARDHRCQLCRQESGDTTKTTIRIPPAAARNKGKAVDRTTSDETVERRSGRVPAGGPSRTVPEQGPSASARKVEREVSPDRQIAALTKQVEQLTLQVEQNREQTLLVLERLAMEELARRERMKEREARRKEREDRRKEKREMKAAKVIEAELARLRPRASKRRRT